MCAVICIPSDRYNGQNHFIDIRAFYRYKKFAIDIRNYVSISIKADNVIEIKVLTSRHGNKSDHGFLIDHNLCYTHLTIRLTTHFSSWLHMDMAGWLQTGTATACLYHNPWSQEQKNTYVYSNNFQSNKYAKLFIF